MGPQHGLQSTGEGDGNSGCGGHGSGCVRYAFGKWAFRIGPAGHDCHMGPQPTARGWQLGAWGKTQGDIPTVGDTKYTEPQGKRMSQTGPRARHPKEVAGQGPALRAARGCTMRVGCVPLLRRVCWWAVSSATVLAEPACESTSSVSLKGEGEEGAGGLQSVTP